jgi:hypothetical protein
MGFYVQPSGVPMQTNRIAYVLCHTHHYTDTDVVYYMMSMIYDPRIYR